MTGSSNTKTTIKIDDVLSWEPCEAYEERETLLELTGGREELTPLEVTRLKIPVVDILWVLLRPEILGELVLRLCACDIAVCAAAARVAPATTTEAATEARLRADQEWQLIRLRRYLTEHNEEPKP